jgi:hypothetical protein
MTMRIQPTLPIVAALGLALAGPAMAQSQGGSGSSTTPGTTLGATQGTTQAQSPAPGQQGRTGSQAQAMSQQQLRQQLTQAGFRDVQIVDAAYLVQARTQDGNTVLMMINPPSAGGMQGASMGSGASTSGASGSGPGAATSGGTGGSGQGR